MLHLFLSFSPLHGSSLNQKSFHTDQLLLMPLMEQRNT